MEAKAHSNELSNAGKSKPRTVNGWKNHEQIGSAIEQAQAGLGCIAGESWGLSKDGHYQLSNRFGHAATPTARWSSTALLHES